MQLLLMRCNVNEGPLERARGHIRSKRLENVIFTRKSDGLQALHAGEADTMIAAGMGGGLVIRILEDSPEITADLKEFILNSVCQRKFWMLKFHLLQNSAQE